LHASGEEMKRLLKLNLIEFKDVTPTDINHWYQEMQKFCSNMKESIQVNH
jgi:hypothetical protein